MRYIVIIMMIMSCFVFAGLETMGSYSALLRTVDICVGKGKIVQHGTHEELIKKEGIYQRFVDSRK